MMKNEERMNWIKKMNELPYTPPELIIGENFSREEDVTLDSSGFGAERDDTGAWVECRQHGGIKIGDNVTIKSGTKIKRATILGKFTEIGNGTKICSLVNIGHNCKIGKDNFVGPQVCFNGSVETGDRCWISGHAIIKDRIKIGNDVTIGMGAVVIADVPDGATVVGNPAILIEYIGNYVHPSFKHGKNFKIGKYNIIGEGVKVGDNVSIDSFNKIEDTVIGDDVEIGNYNEFVGVRIGNRTKIKSKTELRPKTIIGADCKIDSGVKSSGECEIGNNVTIRYDSIIARNVKIENNVFIAPQVMFINIEFIHKGPRKTTIIRSGVKIGTNATINASIEIAKNVIIGARALVAKDCLDEGTVYRASSEIVAKRR